MQSQPAAPRFSAPRRPRIPEPARQGLFALTTRPALVHGPSCIRIPVIHGKQPSEVTTSANSSPASQTLSRATTWGWVRPIGPYGPLAHARVEFGPTAVIRG